LIINEDTKGIGLELDRIGISMAVDSGSAGIVDEVVRD
jgi:predicted N-acetyltransferase YhbS